MDLLLMENLIISLQVVAPLFFMMMLGYGIKLLKIGDAHTFDQMNVMVFKAFLPILLFKNIYTCDLSISFDPRLLIFSVVAILALFLLGFLVILPIEKENSRRGVLIQDIFRSNFIIFGIPIIASLYGEESTGIAALSIAVVVPMYNILAVISLEVFRGQSINIKNILKGLVKNPLIVTALVALGVLFAGWKLPPFAEDTIASLSQITTPLAFVILGGSFTFSSVGKDLRPLIIGLAGKLVLAPLVGVTASLLAGFRGAALVVLMVMFAAPPAVSSFTMAQQMEGDGELAGHLVVIGSLLSVVTLFAFTFTLKQLGYI